MNLQKIRDWLDAVVKVATIVAFIAGGVWAYYQFRVTDTGEISAVVAVSGEVLPYSHDSRLLLVHARPKNIGKATQAVSDYLTTVAEPALDGIIIRLRRVPTGD